VKSTWAEVGVVVAIVIGAWLLTRLTGLIAHVVVRRVADRSLVMPSRWWRARTRVGEEPPEVGEQRRRQRIDAAARMVNHLVAVVVWIAVVITVFHLLDVDAAFFLSSAGFLGAGLAIGGQHKVNDYLTGLSVHFEDRYGVGDEVEVDLGTGVPVHAVVDHIGLFSTRLRDERSTLHLPNGALAQVRNLSQEAASATFRLQVSGTRVDEVAEVADTLRGLAGSSELTDVVFVGDIASHRPNTGEIEVDVRTLRPLDGRSRAELVKRAERALRQRD
jgi:small-conductance mechanosensitive channel